MLATILLVEDDPAVRQLVAEMLTEGGYRVISAATPEQALRVLFDGTAIDLLVTDIIMPGLDGFALANEVKRLRPSARVLYVSGHIDPMRLRGDQRHGPVLKKPFRQSELLEAIKDALDG